MLPRLHSYCTLKKHQTNQCIPKINRAYASELIPNNTHIHKLALTEDASIQLDAPDDIRSISPRRDVSLHKPPAR